jgi:hypothetical protein
MKLPAGGSLRTTPFKALRRKLPARGTRSLREVMNGFLSNVRSRHFGADWSGRRPHFIAGSISVNSSVCKRLKFLAPGDVSNSIFATTMHVFFRRFLQAESFAIACVFADVSASATLDWVDKFVHRIP